MNAYEMIMPSPLQVTHWQEDVLHDTLSLSTALLLWTVCFTCSLGCCLEVAGDTFCTSLASQVPWTPGIKPGVSCLQGWPPLQA